MMLMTPMKQREEYPLLAPAYFFVSFIYQNFVETSNSRIIFSTFCGSRRSSRRGNPGWSDPPPPPSVTSTGSISVRDRNRHRHRYALELYTLQADVPFTSLPGSERSTYVGEQLHAFSCSGNVISLSIRRQTSQGGGGGARKRRMQELQGQRLERKDSSQEQHEKHGIV